MKNYLTEIKALSVANKNVQQYLKENRSQFANISTALHSINILIADEGYTLSESDGTHHRTVYYGDKGKADISIIDKSGNIINSKVVLNWKQTDTGLGWKIAVNIK